MAMRQMAMAMAMAARPLPRARSRTVAATGECCPGGHRRSGA
jgi:hypothetical protein